MLVGRIFWLAAAHDIIEAAKQANPAREKGVDTHWRTIDSCSLKPEKQKTWGHEEVTKSEKMMQQWRRNHC